LAVRHLPTVQQLGRCPWIKEQEVADDATYEKFRNCAVEVLQVTAEKVVPGEIKLADPK